MELTRNDYERFTNDRFWKVMQADIEERMEMLKYDWRKESPFIPEGATKIANIQGQLNELDWIRELPNLILDDIEKKDERELIKQRLEESERRK